MSFHSLNNFITTFVADTFRLGTNFVIVLWVANLIASYLILYKLYIYLPEKLNKIEIRGPVC